MLLRSANFPRPPPPPPPALFNFSSSAAYSQKSLGFRSPSAVLPPAAGSGHLVRCSISQVHSYGTVDYEQRPALKWSSLYRRISNIQGLGVGPAAELERWEEEERRLSKWELCRVAKELRKFRRFRQALEVYDWMAAQGDRFTLTSSDMAVQLDLIAKVRGISPAEEHFLKLPDILKDKRTHGALLNVYGQAKMKEKAEAIFEIMRTQGYATDALPFNIMMTLYVNLREPEKVDMIIEEMKHRNVILDTYSYNILITNYAAMEDEGGMERVVGQMTSDSRVNANWTTYTTLATMYIRLGNFEKAQSCLKDAEVRLTGRDRTPFHYLLGLYSSIGKREEVYRIWNWYKSLYPSIWNLGYQSMFSALIKLDDINGAEMIYEEWISTTANYDPRICNIIMRWYAREGFAGKAKHVLDRLIEKGGKPKPITWEILAECFIKERKISEALSCMNEAASYVGTSNWRPKPTNVANFLALCKEQDNTASESIFMDVLRNRGWNEKEEYKSLIGT